MAVPYEIEMKLAITDKTEFARMQNELDNNKNISFQNSINMKALYFDTADGALGKQRLAYRIRRENDFLVATLKGGGSVAAGLHKRLECSVPVVSEEPDLNVFTNTDGAELIVGMPKSANSYIELVRTEFIRYVYIWQDNAAEVEIALDEGWIYGGNSREAILEVELELKYGSETALCKLAAYFESNFRVYPSDKSKFLRGIELRGS